MLRIRGLRKDTNEFIEGDLITQEGPICILSNGVRYEIIKETISVGSGVKDKDGTEIFEGDICEYENSIDGSGIALIERDAGGFNCIWRLGEISKSNIITPMFYLQCGSEWQVIGNLYQNQDLLE